MRNSFIFRLMHGRQRNLYELFPVSSLTELMCKKEKLKCNFLDIILHKNFFYSVLMICYFSLSSALAKTSHMPPKHRNRNQHCVVLTAIAL